MRWRQCDRASCFGLLRSREVNLTTPPVIVGGAFRFAARRAIRYGDGLIPQAPSAGSGSPEEFMPRLRQMAKEAARDPQSLAGRIEAKPAPEPGFARERPLAA